jgi:hypothetical protein
MPTMIDRVRFEIALVFFYVRICTWVLGLEPI